MQSSQRWWSTGTIICSRLFPRNGSSLVHVARLIDEYVMKSLDERVLRAACESGASQSDLDFVVSRTSPNWTEVVIAAAKGGHLHVFRWMRELPDDRGPWETNFYHGIDEAARHGHLETIKWLHARGLSCTSTNTFINAASHGHLAVLKWLRDHSTDIRAFGVAEGMRCAAENGHLATVQWIYEKFEDAVDMADAMAEAAQNGDLDMLQWLHQQRRCSETCSPCVMDAAASGGHFAAVEWLHENCSQCGQNSAASGAALTENYPLPMLQWLHQHYSDRFGSNVMDSAASRGRLATVQWLHEHRSEGCTAYAMNWAAVNGHFEVVRWLHDNRTEGCTTLAMDGAARNGHLDIVKWLHDNRSEGCTSTAIHDAARNGHVDVLRWLVEHFPGKCGENLMETAAWQGHLDVVQYLDENMPQRASGWGLGAAAKQGWLETLLVLMQNYYRDGDVGLWGLITLENAFDEMLAQLSSQHVATESPKWADALELLERFHRCGFYSCATRMLDRVLRAGYLTVVQRFIEHRDESEMCKYAVIATENWDVVLLRWLLVNGTPIDRTSVFELGIYRDLGLVEIAGYLSEADRVQLFCDAVSIRWLKMLKWTLEKTSFNEDKSRASIRNTIKRASSDTVQWLRENLTNGEARTWCL